MRKKARAMNLRCWALEGGNVSDFNLAIVCVTCTAATWHFLFLFNPFKPGFLQSNKPYYIYILFFHIKIFSCVYYRLSILKVCFFPYSRPSPLLALCVFVWLVLVFSLLLCLFVFWSVYLLVSLSFGLFVFWYLCLFVSLSMVSLSFGIFVFLGYLSFGLFVFGLSV